MFKSLIKNSFIKNFLNSINEQLNQPPATSHQPLKRKLKYFIKLFPFLITLFIFTSSCEEEEIFIDEEFSNEQIINKNPLDQKQKVIELAQGIRERIIDYNDNYRKPNQFRKKYGRFDKENTKVINFPQYDDGLMIIIPFKRKKLKGKKVMIAYYKDGIKTYKILSNKNYKKKLRNQTEEGFLTYLPILFDYTYNKVSLNKQKVLNKSMCRDEVVFEDYENCTAYVVNTCSNIGRVIDRLGKGDVCGGEFPNIDLDAPIDPDECPEGYEKSEHGVCQPIGSDPADPANPTDPADPADPDDPEEECDPIEFDCDTEGGDSDDQETDKLKTEKLNDSQKQKLEDAKNDLKNDCIGKVLLDAINSVKIEVGNSQGFQGIYMPKTNTIHFNTDNDISSYVLGPELFHAYQQQLYGNLDDIQDDPNHVGGSNIEFEEKAFNIQRDLLSDGGMFTTYDQIPLSEWLIELEINHPNGVENLSQSELNSWFSALEIFQQHHENSNDMYGKPINYSVKPNAILKLIKEIKNSNCE